MISISTALNEARLGGVLSYLNTGSGRARIRIYGNTRPANGASAGADPLVELALDDPAGEVTGGALVLTAADDALIATSGSGAWARVVNGNGDFAFDADVSGAAGAGDVRLSTITLYAGGLVRLVSAALG